MIIYLLMIIAIPFFAVISNNSKNSRKTMCICCALMFVIIAGLRDSSVGTDTYAYINDYTELSKNINNVKNIDFAFKWLCYLLGLFGAPTSVFLMICNAFFIVGCSYSIYYLSNNVPLSYYLLITFYYYFFSFNGMRQFIGIGLLAFALTLGLNKKYIRMIIVSIIAVLFHKVSLIGVAILPLVFFRKNKWVVRCYLLGVIIAALNYKLILAYILSNNEYYSTYYTDYVQRNGGIMSCVVYLCCFALILVCFNYKNKKNHEIGEVDTLLLLFSFIAAVGGILQIYTFVAMRLFYFFDVFSIISIPNAIESFNNNPTSKENTPNKHKRFTLVVQRNMVPAYFFLILISFIYMMYCFSFNWHQILPYTFTRLF